MWANVFGFPLAMAWDKVTLCVAFFSGILTVYDMRHAETAAAAEYGTDDGDNQAVPVMYADDLNVVAPADDIDSAAAVHRQ